MLCVPTQRRYVGVTCDYARRIRAHMRNPPRRMRADAARYTPFDAHFQCAILSQHPSKLAAMAAEKAAIAHYNTTSSAGYNTLAKHPAWCKNFWHCKNNGLLKK